MSYQSLQNKLQSEAMAESSPLKTAALVIGQVVLYLVFVAAAQRVLAAAIPDVQLAECVAACAACALCLVAYWFQREPIVEGSGRMTLWAAAIGGAFVVALASAGIARFFGAGWSIDATPANIVGCGIAGPIAEEVLYRGIVLRRTEAAFGPRIALVASSVLFAVAHVQPAQMALAFVFGLLLGAVYQKGRSLPVVVTMHILANLCAFVI